jgi:L-fuculose-phosphate aldolase
MQPFDLLTPADQIAMLMRRIYEHAMTTTSGGNLSIRDEDGSIWISPSGVDKGTLRASDVVCITPDGSVIGAHKPSIEYPFHQAIYAARPDLRAIVHAHPADLVAFSIVRQIPDTRIIPQAQDICGQVGYAPYALPGSKELGDNIAGCFAKGFDSVLLENHGVVCAGQSLLQTYHRFETLDFCARLHVHARRLGQPRLLTDEQLKVFRHRKNYLPEYIPVLRTTREKELRKLICEIVHRAYDQHIMTSTEGTLSARLSDDSFLITPYGVDRRYLEPADIVTIAAGQREGGKVPSRAVVLHGEVYARHPEISAIITAQPPQAMAFGVTDAPFNIRTIPESYVMLRDVPKVPFGMQVTEEAKLAAMLGGDCPVVLIENDALVAVGSSILQAFDRLEVAEFTARSILRAKLLGPLVGMDEKQVQALCDAFLKS